MIKEIRDTLRELGLNDLPDGKKIVQEGKEFAKTVKIGRTLFMEKYGVSSEREYKERMKAKKEIMFHMQYGLTDFKASAEGLRYIYEESQKRGHRIDRFGLCLDRIMGLPSEMRKNMPRETGLKLEDDEWVKLGQIVPMQPHFGDHIVYTPASVENLLHVLEAGCTTIGNFSPYFIFEYPGWNDILLRTERFIRALGIIAGLRDKGVMIHSNLDDGFSNQFYDRASIIGMAMMDYHIVNNSIGAKLTPCFGNMVTDSLTRMSTVLILDKIHGPELVGSMIYGDTLSPTLDMDRNFGTLSSYLINDIVMQMYKPTGHAVNPLPNTECIVIPTPDDILQVQMVGAQLAIEAEHQYEVTDFQKIEDYAEFGYQNGKRFFERVMEAFSDVTDVNDPFKMVLGLRRLGANRLENMFCDETPFHGLAIDRQPYIETGVYKMVTEMINGVLEKVHISDALAKKLKGKKAVIASSDVHEYGKIIVYATMNKGGFDVTDIGCNREPKDVVESLIGEKPEVAVISTNNGFALSYAKELKRLAEEAGIWGKTKIFMGGRLNEDAGQAVPVDVTDDLIELGIIPCATIETLIDLIGAAL